MARKKPRGGGRPRPRRHGDHQAHADELRESIERGLNERPPKRPFSVDPRAVLVVTLNRSVADDVWEDVDMLELDGRSLVATVAFSKRVELSTFLHRLARHRAATPSAKGRLLDADLFDAIDEIRFYGPQDRVTPRLRQRLDAVGADDGPIEVDVEIWHPGDTTHAEEARSWVKIVRDAVETADGAVLDWFTSHEAGVQLLRIRVAPTVVDQLAEIDEIASMDLKPTVCAVLSDLDDKTANELPQMAAPSPDAPLFAVIDSGVSGSHPLIGPALYEATTLLPEFNDGADAHGHGTAVAGLALHGSAEDWLQTGALAPHGRLLSIRVLNDRNEFPDRPLWPKAVVEAVEFAARMGCRVINLSIGDRTGAMADRRATRVAALLDDLARRHGLVLVVPTGNVHDPTDYIAPHADSHQEFVRGMLASGNTTLLDPAPSALALTVGALGMDGVLKLGETVMGGPEAPSINTRRGPGVARGLKPEVAVPGGTMALNDTVGFADRRQLKRIVLSHEADALFAWEKGTSLAAPLVTRVATAVQAARPEASSPLIRALVLQAVAPTLIAEALLPDATPSDAERHRIHVVGHGQPTLDGARFSRRNRVVLFDQARLDVDKIVLYEVPIPASFFESGGARTIDLAVCFDPLTRYRRKDYLGSRLFPYLVIGHKIEDIVRVLAEADEDELSADETPSDEEQGAKQPKALEDLRRVYLRPSTAMSSDSANILMRRQLPKRLKPAERPVFHLAVRSTARWSPAGTADAFGVALALGHDKPGIDLHAELRAQLAVPVEVELEA